MIGPPTRRQHKAQWWKEQPESVKDLYREWPELGAAVYGMAGYVERVTRVKSTGEAEVVVYED